MHNSAQIVTPAQGGTLELWGTKANLLKYFILFPKGGNTSGADRTDLHEQEPFHVDSGLFVFCSEDVVVFN